MHELLCVLLSAQPVEVELNHAADATLDEFRSNARGYVGKEGHSLTAAGLDAMLGAAILAQTRDPNGMAVEINFGAVESFESPMVSPAGVSGFLIGDQGLGHIVLKVRDVENSKRFYLEGLGFRLSDFIDMGTDGGPLELTFVH